MKLIERNLSFRFDGVTLDRYNCAGYALGIANIIEIDTSVYNYFCDVINYTKLIGRLLCDKFSHIRIIYDESDLDTNEYLVMFRAEFSHEYKILLNSVMLPFGDVHFIRKDFDGEWTEKLGTGVIRRVPYDIDDYWRIDLNDKEVILYTAPVSMLAVKY